VELFVDDGCGRRRFSGVGVSDPARPGALLVPVQIGHDLAGGTIGLAGKGLPAGGTGLELSLVPDLLADVAGMVAFLDRVTGGDAASGEPFEPWCYEALVALGRNARGRGDETIAGQWFRQAAAADPGRTMAMALAGGSREERPGWRAIPVEARFAHGLRLTGCLVGAEGPRPGSRWPIRMTWEVPPDQPNLKLTWVWVHLLDASGQRALMSGYKLLADLGVPPGDDRREGCAPGLDIPPGLPPGRYRIKAGLYLPTQERRIDVREASVPHGREDLDLGFIDVAAPSP
jgi:hypothetical protein